MRVEPVVHYYYNLFWWEGTKEKADMNQNTRQKYNPGHHQMLTDFVRHFTSVPRLKSIIVLQMSLQL